MKLSVVITTRNEEANIANCIRSFDGRRDDVEIIVVDNSSTDRTKEIAAELGAVVLDSPQLYKEAKTTAEPSMQKKKTHFSCSLRARGDPVAEKWV